MAYMKDATGRRLDSIEIPSAAETFAKDVRPAGSRVVGIGDSITFNNSGGHFQQIVARAGGRVQNGGWYATQGFTIEQIRDTHLPQVLALTGAQKPAACMILGGTNNVGLNSGAGAGSGFNFATSRAAYLDICNDLVAAGTLPIVCTIPPRTDTALSKTNGQTLNSWLRLMAARNGWPLIDYHAKLVNPANGDWASQQSGDNIHPNLRGFRTMTEPLASTLAALFPPGGFVPSPLLYDQANLIPGGSQGFQSDANADGLSDGWSNFGGSGTVVSRVTGDAAIVGAWQCLERPQSGSGLAYVQVNPSITAGFSVGDRMAALCYFKATDFETALNQAATVGLSFRNTGNTILSTITPVSAWVSDLTTVGIGYAEGVVPEGCTKMDFNASLTGTPSTSQGGKLWLAQPTVYNLTALGLA